MSEDTSADNRLPGLEKNGFDCPRCGTFAAQTWRALNRNPSATQFDDSKEVYGRWYTAECARCRESSVWREDRMVFPATGMAALPHASMPPEAKALYEEAREVLGISRRAGTALARAALERLLRTIDPGAGKVNLATRIERVIPEVPESLGQMLTVIRVAGNSSLHVDDEPDDVMILVLDPGETEIVGLIFEAINDLVEEKIAKPSKVSDLYAKIPESLRERVDKVFDAKGQRKPGAEVN